MYDIITIGDTTTDIFFNLNSRKSDLYCLDTMGNWLKLRYGRKIPITQMNKVYGAGNAGNAAVGMSRLGYETAIVAAIGKDEAGEAIRRTFERERVATKFVSAAESLPSNLSVILDYAGDRTILSHHEERAYQLPPLPKTGWLYFSSIRGDIKPYQDDLRKHIKKNKIKLAFNPGSYQLALGSRVLLPILLVTEILFVDVQEAELLTKRRGDRKKLLDHLARLGPRIVVMTDGRNGSYCFDGSIMYAIGIFDFPVVERTGCGDAYAGGFTAAIMSGKKIPEAMRWGSVNAAHAAMEVGSHAGLLRRYQLENLLEKHQWPKARVIS